MKFITAKSLYMTNVYSGCGSCASDTAPTVPTYLSDTATRTVLQGGISGWFALHKSVGGFNDISDQAEWEFLVCEGLLRGRLNGCRLQGGKPESDRQTAQRGACGTEETISKTDTYTITDLENDDLLSANELYEYIECNKDCWIFGFITCDNRVYEPSTVSTYNVITDFVEPTDNSTDAYWQIAVTVKRSPCSSLNMVYVPFMETFGEYLMGLKCNA